MRKVNTIGKILILLGISGGIAALIFGFIIWQDINRISEENTLPVNFTSHNENETGETEINSGEENSNEIPLTEIPTQFDLTIPFTSQAPHSNWNLPYQEFCEEAAILMVHSFHAGLTLPTKEDADQKLREIMDFENNFFGFYKDTTAEETAEILRQFYGYKKVDVLNDFDADTIKFHLANNRPVILPSHGRALGNPNYTSPGPLYHMLVIRGYNENQFITNDSGTRLGEKYVYDIDTVLNAAHDWNNGDVESGAKKLIVAYPNNS